jgi:hypothetical protein
MQRRHIKLALGMQQLGAQELQRLVKRAQEKAETGGAGLTASDIHKLIDAGAKLERLNRGEPESIERQEHIVTVEERRTSVVAVIANPEVRAAMAMVEGRIRAADGNGNGSGPQPEDPDADPADSAAH